MTKISEKNGYTQETQLIQFLAIGQPLIQFVVVRGILIVLVLIYSATFDNK